MYEIKNRVESEFRLDINAITQKLDKVDLLAQKLDQLLSLKGQNSLAQRTSILSLGLIQSIQEACCLCASPTHHMSDCPTAAQLPLFIQEQVQAAQGFSKPNFDPYSNTFNLGWRNHPNFSWKNSQTPSQTTNLQP